MTPGSLSSVIVSVRKPSPVAFGAVVTFGEEPGVAVTDASARTSRWIRDRSVSTAAADATAVTAGATCTARRRASSSTVSEPSASDTCPSTVTVSASGFFARAGANVATGAPAPLRCVVRNANTCGDTGPRLQWPPWPWINCTASAAPNRP